MTETRLELRGITKSFHRRGTEVDALKNIELTIDNGAFVSIVGPSGCGKSTLLRIAAGLDSPSQGQVELDGRPAGPPGPERGMVFQRLALFPHLTVKGNIEFGLKTKGVARHERARIVREHLEMLGLSDFERAFPKELSGGMQQRVAIARALVMEPEILLMDEPFGALDAQTRIAMQEMLQKLVRTTNITTMFVTHSVEEAVYLADHVVVLTARPATVARTITINPNAEWKSLAVPEAEAHAEFVDLKKTVWGLLRADLAAHEPVSADHAAAALSQRG